MESGEDVAYDALVLATGTRHLNPFKYDPDDSDENINKGILHKMADKVKKRARTITIAGLCDAVTNGSRTKYRRVPFLTDKHGVKQT